MAQDIWSYPDFSFNRIESLFSARPVLWIGRPVLWIERPVLCKILETYLEPSFFCKDERVLVINYFDKKLHRRSSTGF